MARMVWVAVGAAGGIFVYRRASSAMELARERGVVGNVSAAATTATSLVSGVRQLVTLASGEVPAGGARVQRRSGATQAMYFAPIPEREVVHHWERAPEGPDLGHWG